MAGAATVKGKGETPTARASARIERGQHCNTRCCPKTQKAPPTDQEMVDQRDSHRENGSADTYGSTTMYL